MPFWVSTHAPIIFILPSTSTPRNIFLTHSNYFYFPNISNHINLLNNSLNCLFTNSIQMNEIYFRFTALVLQLNAVWLSQTAILISIKSVSFLFHSFFCTFNTEFIILSAIQWIICLKHFSQNYADFSIRISFKIINFMINYVIDDLLNSFVYWGIFKIHFI